MRSKHLLKQSYPHCASDNVDGQKHIKQGSKEEADATHNEEMMLMVKKAGGGRNIKDEVTCDNDESACCQHL